MPDSAVPHRNTGDRKNPNFLAVVIMSGIALAVIFAGALLFMWLAGRHAIPQAHARPATALYRQVPAPGVFDRLASSAWLTASGIPLRRDTLSACLACRSRLSAK